MPAAPHTMLLCPRCRYTTTRALLHDGDEPTCPTCGVPLIPSPMPARGALRRRRVTDHLVVREYLAGLHGRMPGRTRRPR